MTSPRKIARWLVAGIVVALTATAFQVSQQVMSSMPDHEHDFWRILVWQLSGWVFWALVAPLLFGRGAALASARPWWRALPGALAVGLALVAAHVAFVTLVVRLVQHYQPVAYYSFAEALSRQIDNWRFVDAAAVVGLTGLGLVLTTYHRTRQLELNETRLETELARAELEALQLQMQPHFLFNTLNSIAALIRRGDRDRALDTVVELGELLRETVGRSQQAVVALRDEVAFLERYVDLQRTRFADRLEVRVALPPECLGFGVPTLSLQPLVENAIRHGMGRRAAGIVVELRGSLDDGDLQLSVSDDGQGLPESFDLARDAGVGLGNLRSRLRRMYGDAAELALERRAGGGTIALLTLPATRVAAPDVPTLDLAALDLAAPDRAGPDLSAGPATDGTSATATTG
jgi:signal transduction histidine kinase